MKEKTWVFKESTPDVPRNEKAVVKDFVETNSPGAARREIYKFLEAAGLVLTERQLVVLTAMLHHYKNTANTKTNLQIQKAKDEIYKLKIRLGEVEPH